MGKKRTSANSGVNDKLQFKAVIERRGGEEEGHVGGIIKD